MIMFAGNPKNTQIQYKISEFSKNAGDLIISYSLCWEFSKDAGF